MPSIQSSHRQTGGGVAVPDLFDGYGRRIPPAGLAAAVQQKNRRYFACVQPMVDYPAIHARLKKHLGDLGDISATTFEHCAKGILEDLRRDEYARNVTKGVGVPFILPQTACRDIGQALEQTYLKAVGQAFHDMFPDRAFQNHYGRSLTGTFSVAPGTRHERLVNAMQRGVVVGWYFPCLTGYSVGAAIEQMAGLPEKFLLAGGIDTCAAFIGSPDLLVRTDGYPPLLWFAALSAEKNGIGYHFEAYGYNLTFNRRPHLDLAAEYWASGLVVYGQS